MAEQKECKKSRWRQKTGENIHSLSRQKTTLQDKKFIMES
jgi:hypothetical protein